MCFIVFRQCFKSVSKVFQKCIKSFQKVFKVFQKCFKVISLYESHCSNPSIWRACFFLRINIFQASLKLILITHAAMSSSSSDDVTKAWFLNVFFYNFDGSTI